MKTTFSFYFILFIFFNYINAYAYDQDRMLWSYDTSERVRGCSLSYKNDIYFTSDNGDFYALDNEGNLMFKYHYDDPNILTVIEI